MALEYRFRTADFRPAPEGWRTVWITQQGMTIAPMPGWIIREEYEFDTPNSDGRSTGSRDVVAGRLEEYGVEPIDFTDKSFWFILGPGEAEPGDAEVAAEIRRRQEERSPDGA